MKVKNSYFVLVSVSTIAYAKLLSKRLTSPIRALCHYTEGLENK